MSETAAAVLMTPEQSVRANELWRIFEARHFTMAQLIMGGKNRKEIACVLGWSLQSVDHILKIHRNYLRAEGIRTDKQHEHVFKRATHTSEVEAQKRKAARKIASYKARKLERVARRQENTDAERIARRAVASMIAEERAEKEAKIAAPAPAPAAEQSAATTC